MTTVNIGTQRHTRVRVLDDPGAGGACHRYHVQDAHGEGKTFATVDFQNGPVKEHGVNGCYQEDLLAIVIHRLEGFQSGDFACAENELALLSVRTALVHLQTRTQKRMERGVEGTNQV